MNDEAVYRTAPATPGLLIRIGKSWGGEVYIGVDVKGQPLSLL